MDAIVQAILNMSVLEVSLIKISQSTPTSFMMEIESRTTKTGPIGATMAPMTVDMIGPKGVFGKLKLPEVKTSPKGTDVHIPEQHIEIVDINAYKAFVKSLMLDKEMTMWLDNGKGTIKALGLNANITYKKKVVLKCMDGPKTEIVKTDLKGPGEFANTLRVWNPSPVEIDLGTVLYDFVNAQNEKVAEQKGKIYLIRGENEVQVQGRVLKPGGVQGDQARLLGAGVEHDSWLNDTNKYMDQPVKLPPQLVEAFKG